MKRYDCDGEGPHSGGVIKKYPLGSGGNVLLCFACWAKENKYRYERGEETGQPENWPQENWYQAEEVKI